MMCTVAYVRQRLPMLKDVSDDELGAAIERATQYVNVRQWGEARACYGIALLAAHLLRAPQSPPVTARSGGGVSETYATQSDQVWLSGTAYGLEFLEARKLVFPERFPASVQAALCGFPGRAFGSWGGD